MTYAAFASVAPKSAAATISRRRPSTRPATVAAALSGAAHGGAGTGGRGRPPPPRPPPGAGSHAWWRGCAVLPAPPDRSGPASHRLGRGGAEGGGQRLQRPARGGT